MRNPSRFNRVAHYRAGMPHLCWCGLSENWFLKECGHLHWLAMAAHSGRASPEFQDTEGRKLYPAFTYLKLVDARLFLIQENQAFSIATAHTEASSTQDYSCHQLWVNGVCIARLEMLSVLVRRDKKGDNRSVVRTGGERRSPGHQPTLTAAALHNAAQRLLQEARSQRNGLDGDALNGDLGANPPLHFAFSPCPDTEFNGAALLYFSSFQSMVERAEWAHREAFGITPGSAWTLNRTLLFRGNLNWGDSVHINLQRPQSIPSQLAHSAGIYRQSDGTLMAVVRTHNVLSSDAKCPDHEPPPTAPALPAAAQFPITATTQRRAVPCADAAV